MTTEHRASRTLVKSAPELWAECSDAESLVRHLGEFGEIKITRLEPETTVTWEGEHASGTVELEPSGWGTRVTLKVQANADEVAPPESGLVAAPVSESHPVQRPDLVEKSNPAEEARPVEEAADAKVEETSAEPASAVAPDPARGRGWRRVIVRTRTWLLSGSASMEVEEEPAARVPESTFPPATEVVHPPATEVVHPPATEVVHPPATDVAVPPPAEREAPEPVGEAATPVREAPTPAVDHEAALSAALDSLGRAHHRPYSRA